MRWREVDEDQERDIREQREAHDYPPPGWRPGSDTIEAIEGPQENEWVDAGIKGIRVADVDARELEHVQDPSDFHKTRHDEMVDGFEKLDEVVDPALERGADSDYFRELDQRQGLDYEHGYQRVYEAFYGDSSVRVEKDGDVYRVINGAHRLSVARELGRETVPARVLERRRRDATG